MLVAPLERSDELVLLRLLQVADMVAIGVRLHSVLAEHPGRLEEMPDLCAI